MRWIRAVEADQVQRHARQGQVQKKLQMYSDSNTSRCFGRKKTSENDVTSASYISLGTGTSQRRKREDSLVRGRNHQAGLFTNAVNEELSEKFMKVLSRVVDVLLSLQENS